MYSFIYLFMIYYKTIHLIFLEAIIQFYNNEYIMLNKGKLNLKK